MTARRPAIRQMIRQELEKCQATIQAVVKAKAETTAGDAQSVPSPTANAAASLAPVKLTNYGE